MYYYCEAPGRQLSLNPEIETSKKRSPKINYLQQYLGTIQQMDSIKFMQQLPKESIGVCVTSPPYNLKNSTGNGMKNSSNGNWKNAALLDGYATYEDNMPYADYVKWQRSCLGAMMRVLRPDGAIFYNHKWRVQAGLLQDRSEIVSGFPVRQIIIWRRKGGFNFNPGYFVPTYEVIYLIAKPDFKLASGANSHGDVWDIGQERNNIHPAPFPLELARRCIQASPEGVVLDPFMGSGTTAVAASESGRQWLGCEIAQHYIDMANQRLRFADNPFQAIMSIERWPTP